MMTRQFPKACDFVARICTLHLYKNKLTYARIALSNDDWILFRLGSCPATDSERNSMTGDWIPKDDRLGT